MGATARDRRYRCLQRWPEWPAIPPCRGVGRGQAMVEFALVSPLFFFLLFGLIECGIFSAQRSSFTFAVRSATRIGSIHAHETDANSQICAALISSLKSASANPADLGQVTIFRADDGAGGMDTTLADNPNAHDVGTCAADGKWSYLNGIVPSCPPTPGNASWPYCARNVIDPPDPLGVSATYHFHYVLPIFGGGVTIRETSILRIEPQCAPGSTAATC